MAKQERAVPNRPLVFLGAITIACVCPVALFIAIVLGLAFATPPQPLPLGTIQWDYETGFTVDAVNRTDTIQDGRRTYRARGEFYIVHARVLCPFGERFHWNDRGVAVETFSGSGGSHQLAQKFSVDEIIQRILDHRTHRAGPEHTVLGASQREDLVFDLPKNIEQPALVFFAANDPLDVVDNLRAGRVWRPHRFNIRYD